MPWRVIAVASAMITFLFSVLWPAFALGLRYSSSPMGYVAAFGLLFPALALVLPPIWLGRKTQAHRFASGTIAGIIGWALVVPAMLMVYPLSLQLAFYGASFPSGLGQGEAILALVASIVGVLLSPLMGLIAALSGKWYDRVAANRLVTEEAGMGEPA
jgi:hypothetical protein